jgi:hypothetical protein
LSEIILYEVGGSKIHSAQTPIFNHGKKKNFLLHDA